MKKIGIALAVVMACSVSAPLMAKPPGGLPPGLQKKAAQGNLPPGWQKKLAVGHRLDRDIYRHGRIISPVDKHGYVTVQIEDRRLRLIAATLEIINILN
ncbi:hypothetical protein IMCC21906_02658 [Spongiibacter sp. IMCC21906]|jgi:hypothetical protein|uniref:hypothetical protein n=1 Tax=Spongiibacter sp. IMCC21906 TaxID=1620392 RepID=UPI00062E037D|nr:hypothetical protein [Spongiibacter sp. IMCC21906]AKH70303.1 hypothetical protein IMCC21906_02658 [Spongiibacter sp. IMCC21906]